MPTEVQGNLEKIVYTLSEGVGPRSYLQPDVLKKAADYIKSEFGKYGYQVLSQEFSYDGKMYENIAVEIKGTSAPEKILVIGAHYDTVPGTPGADDNASGIAGLLELARLLKGGSFAMTIRFVAFTLEEPPFFRSRHMGSYVYAKSMKERGEQVEGMICLEMIGYFSDIPKSQFYPVSFMRWFFPDAGNFISLVSDLHSREFLHQVKEGFQQGTDLPVEYISTLSIVPGIDFSDHRSFWEFGYRALMVTDTSFYRNANYHEETDTPDTLDYARMAKVVIGLKTAVESLAAKQ